MALARRVSLWMRPQPVKRGWEDGSAGAERSRFQGNHKIEFSIAARSLS
jgi:hypothetical protein